MSVFRASQPDAREYYAMPLRQRLLAFGVPLRPSDADVTLNLQALLDLACGRGRYDDIEYESPLEPRLSDEDAKWIDQLLKEKRLR